MKILAVIPARGGSRRIPHKNEKILLNKPLIAWSIESAIKSKLDRVIVSTDDVKIADIAREYGAEVPFIRPEELSGDKMGIEPVLKHAYEWLKQNQNYQPDLIALLQPTNPTRTTEQIDEAIKIFEDKKPDSVVSVIRATANNNPYWILKKDKDDKVTLFTGEPLKKIITRSQDLPECYSRNDIIYLLRPKNLYEDVPNLYGEKVELFTMDDKYNVDINTEEDWFIAEQKMKLLESNKK
ncbi:MAG: CMP-N-acetylneuraminic acid synthetase [Parcubacteria group bacterium GW2011_GWF2_38_76]|nr:MAG: CMP-N-acetylneuraminic acid synthetase [Parcubacteria group bacterium GW2011_GWF2_38_76]HBM45780.1 acylneuraminate cytidylyltransferase [Patescibacteria group bacterium]